MLFVAKFNFDTNNCTLVEQNNQIFEKVRIKSPNLIRIQTWNKILEKVFDKPHL